MTNLATSRSGPGHWVNRPEQDQVHGPAPERPRPAALDTAGGEGSGIRPRISWVHAPAMSPRPRRTSACGPILSLIPREEKGGRTVPRYRTTAPVLSPEAQPVRTARVPAAEPGPCSV